MELKKLQFQGEDIEQVLHRIIIPKDIDNNNSTNWIGRSALSEEMLIDTDRRNRRAWRI